jgi:hypothetical protein
MPRPVASRRRVRAADVDRLAGHHRGDRLAHVHRVGVHHPGHGLLVGAHVRRGHVLLRPDELHQLGGVAAGHALQLALRHLVRIADDAALGPAEGDVDHRALPGHPTGQRAHLVQRHIRRVAHTALGWPARRGVLHAVAGEDLDPPIVHAHRDVDDHFAGGLPEDLPYSLVQVELLRGEVEAGLLRQPGFVSCSKDIAPGSAAWVEGCLRSVAGISDSVTIGCTILSAGRSFTFCGMIAQTRGV